MIDIKLTRILILFCLFAACAPTASAQTKTLTFNQVLILSNGTQYTVPSGKVWKLESAVYSSYSMDYNNYATTLINGSTITFMPFSFYDGNSWARAPIATSFPFWLPTGSTVQPTGRTSMISVIEFNVVTTP